MEQLKDLKENRFTLTFNKKIEEPSALIRFGDELGPIRERVDLKCITRGKTKQSSDQQKKGKRGKKKSSKSVDFLIGEDGYIITELSSGNLCSQQHRRP